MDRCSRGVHLLQSGLLVMLYYYVGLSGVAVAGESTSVAHV